MLRSLRLCSQLQHSSRKTLSLAVNNLATSPYGTCRSEQHVNPDKSVQLLSNVLGGMHLYDNRSKARCKPQSQAYILPTTFINSVYKRTIIDPKHQTTYTLPTCSSILLEKLTPSIQTNVPIVDPCPIQNGIDQSGQPIMKHAMPYLITIRHKKMKKHKLKKFRKRLLPLHKKLRAIKLKKKEKALQMLEQEIVKGAESFNAEAFVNEQIAKARKGGWSIDILKTRGEEKAAS